MSLSRAPPVGAWGKVDSWVPFMDARRGRSQDQSCPSPPSSLDLQVCMTPRSPRYPRGSGLETKVRTESRAVIYLKKKRRNRHKAVDLNGGKNRTFGQWKCRLWCPLYSAEGKFCLLTWGPPSCSFTATSCQNISRCGRGSGRVERHGLFLTPSNAQAPLAPRAPRL